MKKYSLKTGNVLLGFCILFCSMALNAQIITTAVGTGNNSYSGDSLQALATSLSLPEGGLALDSAGNLYFCDHTNQRVRKLNIATGIVSNVAGNGTAGFSGDGGPAKLAKLGDPTAVAVDKHGYIYIADYSNYRLRKVNPYTGIITTVAGNGNYGFNSDGILATNAWLTEVTGIAIDTAGNIFFTELGARVRRIDKTTGLISTAVGTGTAGYNSDNILATNAKINLPYGIAFDKHNDMYIADNGNYRIRKVTTTTGIITTVAGNGIYGNGGDGGSATSASFKAPWGVAVDTSGNILIADRTDNKVRQVVSGIINTVAGTGASGYGGDGGLATNGLLANSSGVVATKCGAFYITDRFNNRIRKVSAYNFSATTTDLKCFAICTGSIGTTASGGLAPYTYTWTGGLGAGPNHTNVCAGNYLGICTDANGCQEQLSINILQPSQFTIASTTQTNVTCNSNGSGLGYLSGGAGAPYTYTWSGSTSTTAIGYNLAPGIHTLSVKDVNGCLTTKTLNILFTPTLGLSVNVTDALCGSLGSATANASGTGAFSYSWSVSSSTSSFVLNVMAGNYSVTVADANGCMITNTFVISLLTPTFASVPICFVTVDSLSQHNVITWDKNLFPHADSFFVYRETGTNLYQKIRSQPFSAFSQFVDTVKTLYFPNTGDPNVGTYRYKIKTMDSCANNSEFSPYHNTLFMVNNNGTFSWTQLYAIEGDPNPVSAYVLERDNLSNNNWQAIGSVAGTQQFIIDPNYSTYQSTGSWRVRTQWAISCIPSRSSSFSLNSSYSNRITNNPTGIKENAIDHYLGIYPNPSNGKVTIVLKGGSSGSKKMNLEISSITGEKIYSTNGEIFNSIQLDLSGYANGMYFITFTTDTQSSKGKIILEK